MGTYLKCGYIALINHKDFVIYCTLCGSKYKHTAKYFRHVLDFHNLKGVQKVVIKVDFSRYMY